MWKSHLHDYENYNYSLLLMELSRWLLKREH